jgi:cell division protein FtsB
MLLDMTNRDIQKFLNDEKNRDAVEKHGRLIKQMKEAQDMIKQIEMTTNEYQMQAENIDNMILTLNELLRDKSINRTQYNVQMAQNMGDRTVINEEVKRLTATLNARRDYIARLNREKLNAESQLRPYFAMVQTVERVKRHIFYLSAKY